MDTNPFAEIKDEVKRKQAEAAKDKGSALVEFANSADWVNYDQKDGITVFTMKSDSGLNCVKGEGNVSFNANVFDEFAFRSEIKPACDDGCEESTCLEAFGDDTKFEYLRYKGKLLVSGRDFTTVSHRYTDADGRILISAYSVVNEDKPEQDGYVRGNIIKAGYVITPDKDNDDKCFVQYVTEIDFAGNLPTVLVNQVNSKQGFSLVRVVEELKKEYE